MRRRELRFLLIVSALWFCLPRTFLGSGEEGKLPNIVFILADDLGYGDPGCYNEESKIPTPHMDRLAAGGMRFTDAHTPSAVCTPTRYGILTGRYAFRTPLKRGVLWGFSPPLIEPGRMTVASLLKRHGYTTACVGKWHLGLGYVDHPPLIGLIAAVTRIIFGDSLLALRLPAAVAVTDH